MRISITVLFTLCLAVFVSASGRGTEPTAKLPVKKMTAFKPGTKPTEVIPGNRPTDPWGKTPPNAKSQGNQASFPMIGNDASSSNAATTTPAQHSETDEEKAKRIFPLGAHIWVEPSAFEVTHGKPHTNAVRHPGFVVGHQGSFLKVRYLSHNIRMESAPTKEVMPQRLQKLQDETSRVNIGSPFLVDWKSRGLLRGSDLMDMNTAELEFFERHCEDAAKELAAREVANKGGNKGVKQHVRRRY